jgi:hypothetical protein
MPAIPTDRPRVNRRRARDVQRAAHLLAGVALVALVYAGPALGPAFTDAVQWVVLPLAVASGIALWKWPRIRSALRGRSRRT